ncbi:uncharacterized protein Z519_05364 [Cladophialophora bantiana CBS 173.52]|uniref:ribonuclease T1 n=1 Tax=Cladophialophora bantiana (strain ATCC 10958 / CBS 173.52 / CDC B-1940 / NIH 8579) TaxID=1442370 RepID=A0A0D2HLA4_CLAB1|nr:uncharacterized protein Z519_05364 [Cladophialophora bantiana CBS 173.52]KIW94048.1 hypothetical protein Z519_05364 [Cladophialophora bantiana CBS 173.52]
MQLVQILASVLFNLPWALALPPELSSSKQPVSPSFWPRKFHPSSLTKRQQSCAETCGDVCYYQSTIDAAVSKGYSLFQSGQTEGSDDYPHQYNNYEGFDFPVDGPYYEFPIMDDFEVYDGGSPGPDRVIFNDEGDYAGVITHTGASGDDFVACAGEDL